MHVIALLLTQRAGMYDVQDTGNRRGDQPASDAVAMSDSSRDSAPIGNSTNSNSGGVARGGRNPVILIANRTIELDDGHRLASSNA